MRGGPPTLPEVSGAGWQGKVVGQVLRMKRQRMPLAGEKRRERQECDSSYLFWGPVGSSWPCRWGDLRSSVGVSRPDGVGVSWTEA